MHAFLSLCFCSVLVIDCKQDIVSLIGDYGLQSAKWGSPVIVPLQPTVKQPIESPHTTPPDDVVIVCPPLNASHVLVIDPVTHKTCLVGDEFPTDNFKYDGACLGSDGAVYCAPSCSTQFLRIEVVGTLVEEFGDVSGMRDSMHDSEDSEERSPWEEEKDDSDNSTVHILTQRMKNLLHVGSSSSSLTSPTRPSRVHIANSNNPILTSPASPKRQRSVTFDLGDKDTKGILKNSIHTARRLCYQWPPAILLTYHGAERIGNFKFGAMAMSADGKAAIAVPMNVLITLASSLYIGYIFSTFNGLLFF